MRDAEQAEDGAVLVTIDAFGDQVRLRCTALVDRHAFEMLRPAGGEHLAVVLDEAARGGFGIELEIALAEDLLSRLAEKARGSGVDEDVAPFEILDEDRVGRRLEDCAENLVAVGQRHGAHITPDAAATAGHDGGTG